MYNVRVKITMMMMMTMTTPTRTPIILRRGKLTKMVLKIFYKVMMTYLTKNLLGRNF